MMHHHAYIFICIWHSDTKSPPLSQAYDAAKVTAYFWEQRFCCCVENFSVHNMRARTRKEHYSVFCWRKFPEGSVGTAFLRAQILLQPWRALVCTTQGDEPYGDFVDGNFPKEKFQSDQKMEIG